MAESRNDHERRIATIEGEMKSVATKADLAHLETRITQSVQNTINAQTTELKEALKEQSGEIRDLREKDSRMRGVGDTLKVVAPFIVSIVAVLVAILK